MTTVNINVFPERASHVQRVELDGTIYRLRLIWRERLKSWYMDLYDRNDNELLLGMRLIPGWGPLFGIEREANGLPPGEFIVSGAEIDNPTQEILGTNELRLSYIPFADLPGAPTDFVPTVS